MIQQYKEMLAVKGYSRRERTINKNKHDINKLVIQNPSYEIVEIDGEEREVSIISSTVIYEKIIESMPGEDFMIGQVVYWNKQHWYITERDNKNPITTKGIMQQCNRKFRWQNKKTGEIIERWVIQKKPYYSNLKNNGVVERSEREFDCKMVYDDEVANIGVGFRFLLDIIAGEPITYRVINADINTGRYDIDGERVGFLIFNIKEDQYNEKTDNVELMIADYIDPEDIGSHSTALLKSAIEFTGQPEVKIGGSKKKFTAKFMDAEGNQVDVEPVWGLEYADDFSQYITTTTEPDGKFSIKVGNNGLMDGATLKVTLSDASGAYSSYLEVKVVMLI